MDGFSYTPNKRNYYNKNLSTEQNVLNYLDGVSPTANSVANIPGVTEIQPTNPTFDSFRGSESYSPVGGSPSNINVNVGSGPSSGTLVKVPVADGVYKMMTPGEAKLHSEYQLNQGKLDWQNSGWGKFSQGVDIANGAMNLLNSGFSLYSNIADYSTKRAMNKEKLENARLTNQALREDMQNRRNEIARLGKMRSNAAAQQASGSINTRG